MPGPTAFWTPPTWLRCSAGIEFGWPDQHQADDPKRCLHQQQLSVEIMGRGYAWLDTGTHDSLMEAGQFIATLEKRQGLKVACPEEVAFRARWISAEQLERQARPMLKNGYGRYLMQVVRERVY